MEKWGEEEYKSWGRGAALAWHVCFLLLKEQTVLSFRMEARVRQGGDSGNVPEASSFNCQWDMK